MLLLDANKIFLNVNELHNHITLNQYQEEIFIKPNKKYLTMNERMTPFRVQRRKKIELRT